MKHIGQVYVTSELKIKLVYFFTICPMIYIFIAVKNGYLNLSAVLKFAKTQNELNEAMQPTTSYNDLRPVFPCPQPGRF